MQINHHFATYGTLAPGRPNHHQLAALRGTWVEGTVKGHLVAQGWGAAMGYPALVLDDQGGAVAVSLLHSADLPDHWQRLDEFEGSEYRRVATRVDTDNGPVGAWIYVHAATKPD